MLTLTYKCFLSGKRLKSTPFSRYLSSNVKTFQEDGFIQQFKVNLISMNYLPKFSNLLCFKIYEEKEMVDLREKFNKLEASMPNKRFNPQEINYHFTHKYCCFDFDDGPLTHLCF